MELTDAQIYDCLGSIKGLPTCSQWAAGFADSIREQIEKGRSLSDRQKTFCYKILNENSEEEQKKLREWESEYNSCHKQEATKLAHYYRSAAGGYYGDLVKGILADKVPNRRKYLKMRNNKYAKKVLAELGRPPRFTVDDHVIPNSKFTVGYSFRNTMMLPTDGNFASSEDKRNFASRGGIILGVDNIVVSAAKGSKRYMILPFGASETFFVEERYLKKKPKVKKA